MLLVATALSSLVAVVKVSHGHIQVYHRLNLADILDYILHLDIQQPVGLNWVCYISYPKNNTAIFNWQVRYYFILSSVSLDLL